MSSPSGDFFPAGTELYDDGGGDAMAGKDPYSLSLNLQPISLTGTTFTVDDVADEDLSLEDDEEDEKEVDQNGNLHQGKTYPCKAFEVTGRGRKLFFLEEDVERVFNLLPGGLRHRGLYRITLNDMEKLDLISRGILPRMTLFQITAVFTAKTILRKFGTSMTLDNRSAADDSWVAQATSPWLSVYPGACELIESPSAGELFLQNGHQDNDPRFHYSSSSHEDVDSTGANDGFEGPSRTPESECLDEECASDGGRPTTPSRNRAANLASYGRKITDAGMSPFLMDAMASYLVRQWISSRTIPPSRGAGLSDAAERTTGSQKSVSNPGRGSRETHSGKLQQSLKRKHEHLDANEDEDEGHAKRLQGRSSSEIIDEIPKRLLRCPFHAYDAQRYSEQNRVEKEYRRCASCFINNIPRLKCVVFLPSAKFCFQHTDSSTQRQHLYRVHQKPPYYCGCCYITFANRASLDEHSRQRPPCTISEPGYLEKMTDEQLQEIRQRDVGKSVEEKWFAIFATLFPGAMMPSSPYVNAELEGEIQNFLGYFRREAPPLIEREFLREELQPMTENMRLATNHVLQLAISHIVTGYRMAGRSANPSSRTPLVASPRRATLCNREARTARATHLSLRTNTHPGMAEKIVHATSMKISAEASISRRPCGDRRNQGSRADVYSGNRSTITDHLSELDRAIIASTTNDTGLDLYDLIDPETESYAVANLDNNNPSTQLPNCSSPPPVSSVPQLIHHPTEPVENDELPVFEWTSRLLSDADFEWLGSEKTTSPEFRSHDERMAELNECETPLSYPDSSAENNDFF